MPMMIDGPRAIEFPKAEPQWLDHRDCVRFFAIADDSVFHCLISIEALIFYFGAKNNTEGEAIRTFNEHRSEIEKAARRKIESGEVLGGGEVLLRSTDFPQLKKTIPAHPITKNLIARESPAIKEDADLLRGVRAVNVILQEDFVRKGMRVTAEWDTILTKAEPLVRLKLTDDETNATVDDAFTRNDLGKLALKKYPLYRLWGDLLREKGRLLSQSYQGEGEMGE